MVFSNTDIVAGMMDGASLTDYNIAGLYRFTAKNLNSQSLTFRFAAVL